MNDLAGRKFGRLLVLGDSSRRCGTNVLWRCLCDCGNITEIRTGNLRNGNTKSCGCLRIDFFYKHGHLNKEKRIGRSYSQDRLYNIWIGMKSRCNYAKNKNFKYYGKKGISVCGEWQNDFLAFKNWALQNGYEKNLTIDRIDNNDNYKPSNCQWLSQVENARKGNEKNLHTL